MSKSMKLPKRIQAALDEVKHYRIEAGGRHIRIFVNEALTGVVPFRTRGDGQDAGRATFNVVAQIRRAARMMPA
jgi:hypothetical protein